MSEDLLIKAKPEFINLALEALKACPKLLSEKGLCEQVNLYADAVATQLKDFKQSAAVRQCMENPDSNPVEYQCLLNALKMKYLGDVFMDLHRQCAASAMGLFNAALSRVPFTPAFGCPDNEYGAYMYDQIAGMFEGMGIVKPGELKKQHIDAPKRIIEG